MRRLVWLLLDGAAHWLLEQFLAEGALPALAALRRRGWWRATTPEPPNLETPAQLATLYTGRPQREHGILGFHVPAPQNPFQKWSGFRPELLRAEPFWRRALAAGHTVALAHAAFVRLPGGDDRHPGVQLLVDGYGQEEEGATFVSPPCLRERFLEEVGPFVGNGCTEEYLDGEITLAQYAASLHRVAEYFRRVARFVLKEVPADLTLLYTPVPDEAAHMMLMDAEAGDREARQILQNAYSWADQTVAEVVELLSEEDVLFVLSDHGLAGVHTQVHVNRVLAEAGLAAFDSEGRLVPEGTRVFLPPANHGYLHVTNTARPQDLAEARRLLAELKDPRTGKPVLAEILPPGELFGPETGAAFLVPRRGYQLSAEDAPSVLSPSRLRGHHQAGAARPEFQGFLLGAGCAPPAPPGPVPNRAVAGLIEQALASLRA